MSLRTELVSKDLSSHKQFLKWFLESISKLSHVIVVVPLQLRYVQTI